MINGCACMCVSDGDGMDRVGQPWVSTARDSVSSVFARTTAIVNGLVCDWHRRVCLSSPSSPASSLRKPHPPSLVYKISSHLAFAFFLSQAAWALPRMKKSYESTAKMWKHYLTCSDMLAIYFYIWEQQQNISVKFDWPNMGNKIWFWEIEVGSQGTKGGWES